ncbi:ABC transporter ATP-binding protein [Bogoriella caseilytica]|uniref:Peptide/nickel transport system ATP-binding protein n=1 Tax=Bogoriella caseilytica TaxID=56055 RepID=A0A3N2BDA2_9MICO|nr:ABC transporter ATP-binding protein [Bogoriella caseilytica]ROR73212.1 peptide/nickel transport system ATP-binding protein [Bogoriella caseilytica]
MPLLELKDVSITYRGLRGTVPAVRGVNLTLEAGQTLGIAGESGSGKSTLAMAMLRLLPPGTDVSGEILLDDEDVLSMKWGRLRAVRWTGLSMVFQGAMHALNPVYRVGQQIAEPLELHQKLTGSALEERVVELLDQVGMPAWRKDSYPHELSGGQRQRVMIAMALACEPDLIIADEATTALDVMVQAQVLQLLRNLVYERNVGLIMISHDLSVLADMCDRVAVMYAGEVVELGKGHALFTAPRHPYGHALGSAFPVIGDMSARNNPRGLAGDPPDPSDLPSGCPFHPRCPVAREDCSTVKPELLTVPAPDDPARLSACLVAQDGDPIVPAGDPTKEPAL